MDIAILVEPVAGNMFRASCGSPLALQMDAPTREESISDGIDNGEKGIVVYYVQSRFSSSTNSLSCSRFSTAADWKRPNGSGTFSRLT